MPSPQVPENALTDNSENKPLFDPELLAKLAADPIASKKLAEIQNRARKKIDDLAHRMARDYVGELAVDKARANTDHSDPGWSIGHISAESRQRAQAARECRAFARNLLNAALTNLDNPDWNPADPQTDQLSCHSLLSTVLRLKTTD